MQISGSACGRQWLTMASRQSHDVYAHLAILPESYIISPPEALAGDQKRNDALKKGRKYGWR